MRKREQWTVIFSINDTPGGPVTEKHHGTQTPERGDSSQTIISLLHRDENCIAVNKGNDIINIDVIIAKRCTAITLLAFEIRSLLNQLLLLSIYPIMVENR